MKQGEMHHDLRGDGRPFQRRFRLQHVYCIGVSRRSAQATAGKGLAQGTYVAARARVESMTFRLKVIVSTKAPPRPKPRWSEPGASILGDWGSLPPDFGRRRSWSRRVSWEVVDGS